MKIPGHLLASTRLFCMALFATLFTSCLRVQGPPGPQGPEGIPGRDGNANVWSITYQAEEADWFDVGTPGADEYFLALDLDVPEITQDIVDNGIVLVYYRQDDQSPWIALPYTFISHNPEYIEKLDMIYSLGFVGMQSQASDKNATPYVGFFRVVIAEGIPLGKQAFDFSKYENAVEILGLNDAIEITRLVK